MNNGVIKGGKEADRGMMANNNIDSVIYLSVNKFYYQNSNPGKEEVCQSECVEVSFP